jgi:hypothetical protein
VAVAAAINMMALEDQLDQTDYQEDRVVVVDLADQEQIQQDLVEMLHSPCHLVEE